MLFDSFKVLFRVNRHPVTHHNDASNTQKETVADEIDLKSFSNGIMAVNWRRAKMMRLLLEDGTVLIAIGFTVALLSLAMETCIIELQNLRKDLMEWVESEALKIHHVNANLLDNCAWTAYTTLLILLAAISTNLIAPQAIAGSGIPEMTTILRGVMMNEYLSMRTLIAKMLGLTLAIGSGLPIGKEGPFAHIGSIVASQMSRWIKGMKMHSVLFANESHTSEMLAAGCAVGVACTFSAPVGGVLFSIEVTAVYFAVRNYWRGFFAAACSSIFFALLRLYTQSSEVTVVAFYQTAFKHRSFMPEELLFFALIGLFCGITGALFILIHRRLVLFVRGTALLKLLFLDNYILYPVFVSVLHSSLRYSKLFGKFVSGRIIFNHKLWDFFENCTWSAARSSPYACPKELLERWTGFDGEYSLFMQLSLFIITFYFMCIIAVMLPIPAGIFMPVFVVGAAIGRLAGELIAFYFPNGIRGTSTQTPIYPGIYSVVGAAAFCGSVTHTVSVAIIAFEMTGQLLHIVPVTMAVIIANIVGSALQPSFFDSLILLKRLPFLPDIAQSSSAVHAIRIEQIMVRDVISVSKTSTYAHLKHVIDNYGHLSAYPVVLDF
ncbi:unnamed protein product, partial [Anisakis simplex]|uniref:Chloride channel protein n=1 Tax=Anisakis simplex TaxID=6269 RepID=A0A0M3IZM2_ANISI